MCILSASHSLSYSLRCTQLALHSYIFWYYRGKCVERKKNIQWTNNAKMRAAFIRWLHHAHESHHKLKAHRPSHFCSLFHRFKFMVTLQMSIILWPSCCFLCVCVVSYTNIFHTMRVSISGCCGRETKQLSIEFCTQQYKTHHVLWWTAICRWCENYNRRCILCKIGKYLHWSSKTCAICNRRLAKEWAEERRMGGYRGRERERECQSNCKP